MNCRLKQHPAAQSRAIQKHQPHQKSIPGTLIHLSPLPDQDLPAPLPLDSRFLPTVSQNPGNVSDEDPSQEENDHAQNDLKDRKPLAGRTPAPSRSKEIRNDGSAGKGAQGAHHKQEAGHPGIGRSDQVTDEGKAQPQRKPQSRDPYPKVPELPGHGKPDQRHRFERDRANNEIPGKNISPDLIRKDRRRDRPCPSQKLQERNIRNLHGQVAADHFPEHPQNLSRKRPGKQRKRYGNIESYRHISPYLAASGSMLPLSPARIRSAISLIRWSL